jgi:hypothetical protein
MDTSSLSFQRELAQNICFLLHNRVLQGDGASAYLQVGVSRPNTAYLPVDYIGSAGGKCRI